MCHVLHLYRFVIKGLLVVCLTRTYGGVDFQSHEENQSISTIIRFYTKCSAVNTTTPHGQSGGGDTRRFSCSNMHVPSFETVFEKIEKSFLHHVGHLVALQ